MADPRAARACVPSGTLHPLDTCDVRGGYVLDCDSGVQVRLSNLAYRILQAVWAGVSLAEIARQCSDADRRLTEGDVERVYARVVAGVEEAEQRRHRHAIEQGFLLRLTLVPAGLVGRLAVPFTVLFAPLAGALCGILLVAGAAAYSLASAHPPHVRANDLVPGYALFVLSCLLHELGHAGACMRFGVRPGSVGLALYLFLPVFYSDVTRIWKLGRWRRVTVDAGGLYVQCLVGAGYALIYLRTHAAACFFAVTLIAAAALIDLNPLFRFDGYWIVSDALGVRGLHGHVLRTLRRFAGRAPAPAPTWPRATAAAVTTYSVVALAAWVWFAVQIARYALDASRWLFASAAVYVPHAAGH